MKKISIVIVLILTAFLITGCQSDKSGTSKVVKTGIMKHKKCTRGATAEEGMEVSLNYDLYYTDDILNIIESNEKVISENQEYLDTYEEAYKKIAAHYKGLKYYDNNVIRTSNSVTNSTIINYDKIDIEKLLEIEGSEDNIVENGKAKVEKWITLAKKFGTTCTDVE